MEDSIHRLPATTTHVSRFLPRGDWTLFLRIEFSIILLIPDGHEALRFLRQHGEYADARRPGLILLDLNLPGLHGLDVLAQIKADPDLRIIPVVILSSSRDPGDIKRCYELHANAYIVKPTGFDGFDDMIKQIDACFAGLIQPPPTG